MPRIGSRVASSGQCPFGYSSKIYGGTNMKDILLKLYIKFQDLLTQDEGQDLVEYALIVALIALACVAGMGKLATAINNGFSTLGTTLTSDL